MAQVDPVTWAGVMTFPDEQLVGFRTHERTAAGTHASRRRNPRRRALARGHRGRRRVAIFDSSPTNRCSCTSPPYGSLIRYPDGAAQLGSLDDYERFLDELDHVWRECERVLVRGGRIACVVGDVLVSRRQGGRHHVLPLTADIQVRARTLGLDCLTPIRWLKVSNIALEASRSARYLGKPNLPNGGGQRASRHCQERH